MQQGVNFLPHQQASLNAERPPKSGFKNSINQKTATLSNPFTYACQIQYVTSFYDC